MKKNKIKKILVVDDDPALTKMLEIILSKNNYKVTIVSTGDNIVADVKRSLPDLILLDVMLPGITGWEICKILRKDKKINHIPVIMMTGLQDEESEHEIRSFDCGVDDYIAKPFDMRVLLSRISAVIKRVSYKKELSEILKVGMLKIVGLVITMILINVIIFWATFNFIIRTSQLGRYAESQLGELLPRMNLLFLLEGSVIILIIGIIIYLFLRLIDKKLVKLENFITKEG